MSELRVKDTLAVEEIDDSIIVFDIENNQFYEMEGIGSYIWKNVQGRSVDEIISMACGEFDEDEAIVADDTRTFLEELLNKELIYEIEE